jgi:AraC-like DNA-binding protein
MAGRAAAYVDAHSHLPISARDVAQHLRLNADYLNRSFRRARGMTISEYIKRRRLREARSLLIEGRLSVAEVAGSCGFSELSYFRRLFRAAEGVSPADFRRLYARVHTNVR